MSEAKVNREDVEKALDVVRPSLQGDGGDVKLLKISDDGTVEVELTGACHGCPLSMITLKSGIERFLKQSVPGVKEVVAAGL